MTSYLFCEPELTNPIYAGGCHLTCAHALGLSVQPEFYRDKGNRKKY